MLGILTVGDASIIVALITAGTTLVAIKRNGRNIEQINNAVNHVGVGEPTLIQRVIRLETATQHDAAWQQQAFGCLAAQLGIELPPHPANAECHK